MQSKSAVLQKHAHLTFSVGPHVIYGGETMIPDRFFDVIMKSI